MPLINLTPFRTPAPVALPWKLDNTTYDSVTLTPPGTSLFFCGNLKFKSDGTKMYIPEADDFSTTQRIHQWTLSTAWLLSSASYDGAHVTGAPATSGPYVGETHYPRGLAFASDGSKMFAVGFSTSGQLMHEWTLTTPWDVTGTVTWSAAYLTTGNDINGLYFKPDGTRFWTSDINGLSPSIVRQYSLSTPWDISTGVTYNSGADYTTGTDVGITDVVVNNTGTKLLLCDMFNGEVWQDDLGTPFDLSTVSSASRFILQFPTIPAAVNSPIEACTWKIDDGLKFYMMDSIYDLYQFSTPLTP